MKRSLYFTVFISFLFQTGVKGNIMNSTLYAIHLDASPAIVGVIIATVSLFPMILAVYAGKVSDRFGCRKPLMLGSIISSIGLLLPVLIINSLIFLFIAQLIFGLGQIFFQVAMQNLIGVFSNQQNRSNHFALLGLGTATASLLGPLITGFAIEYRGFIFSYLLLFSFAMIPFVIMMFQFVSAPTGLTYDKEQHQNARILDLLSSQPLRRAFITSGIILTGIGLYSFYFPIYGESIGLSASVIGMVLSVHASAFFVIRLMMPLLVRKYNEATILINSLIVSAVSFMIIPLFENIIILSVVSFILGLGLGCGQPLSMVMAYNRSPKGRTGEVLGVRLTVNKIAQFSVPIIFGSLGTIMGFIPIFWSNALLLLIGGLFTREKSHEIER